MPSFDPPLAPSLRQARGGKGASQIRLNHGLRLERMAPSFPPQNNHCQPTGRKVWPSPSYAQTGASRPETPTDLLEKTNDVAGRPYAQTLDPVIQKIVAQISE